MLTMVSSSLSLIPLLLSYLCLPVPQAWVELTVIYILMFQLSFFFLTERSTFLTLCILCFFILAPSFWRYLLDVLEINASVSSLQLVGCGPQRLEPLLYTTFWFPVSILCLEWACLARNPIHVLVFMYLCNAFVTEGCHLHHHDCAATCGMLMSVVCTILISTRIFHDTECTYMYLERSQNF